MAPSATPFPFVGSSRSEPGWLRRVGRVGVAGAFVTAWVGLTEAILVTAFRNVPEEAIFLRQAVLGYAAFGLAFGLVWGAMIEGVMRARRRWRRRPFYVGSLIVLVVLFQLVMHTHVHFTGLTLAMGSADSMKVIALMALPAVVIVGVLGFLCLRARPPDSSAILGPRVLAALTLPLLIILALPTVHGVLRASGASGLANVLMIVLDTTRVDRLSAYGYERPTTPTLERLASEGVRFTRAYSAAPWTLPSHASLFTARYPAVHNACWEHQYLDDRLPTLAEHLAGQGLLTAAFSHQAWLSDETGLMRGFEQFHDLYWRSTTALVAAWRMASDRVRKNRGVEDKGAALINRTFLSWLDRHGDEPFFVFINYMEPHAYYEPPTPWREQFLGGRETPWGRSRNVQVNKYNAGLLSYTAEELSTFSDLYDGAVAYQDFRMGQIIDDLRRRGLLEETLLIVTADHGENLGDHELLDHQFCLYDTLLHVPLVVRLPGVLPAGAVSDAPAEHRLRWSMIDLVFGESGGDPIPVDRLASSLRSADEAGGPVLSELYRRPLDTELWESSPRRAAFDRRLRCILLDRMKYIWGSDGRDELYDLAADPGELTNLIGERGADAGVLRDLLAAKVAALEAAGGSEAPVFSEELKRRLKSLGYLD